MILSVVIITHNEEANIGRTLASVQPLVADGKGEIIVVDSGSTDRTVEIAKSFGAKVFVEEWKGYAAQKNSAIDKASGDWILSLDADEEVERELATLNCVLWYRKGHCIRRKNSLLRYTVRGCHLPTISGYLDSSQEQVPGPVDQTRRLLARSQASSISQRHREIRRSRCP